ncbi:MAG: calcium-binding protein, partial [Desulfobacterales bacterium]|nr:calcium-binding protein [Desulfobacterales bacterium]
AGNDTLTGGLGTDGMNGGLGDDTYIVHTGEAQLDLENNQIEAILDEGGNDTLTLEGVNPASIQVSSTATAGALRIDFGTSDHLEIVDGLGGAVENFEIGGETLTTSQLIGRYSATAISGVDANGYQITQGGREDETLYAVGHSTLSGGRGNDTLYGSGGNNTYLYGLGDGIDAIFDFSPKLDAQGTPQPNTLKFGAGISINDITITATAYDIDNGSLHLRPGAAEDQYVAIAGYDQTTTGRIDRFEFADGTILDYQQLLLSRGVDLYGVAGGYTPLIGLDFINRMIGGSGSNTYRVLYTHNQVIEAANGGTDTVEAAIDYQLGDNVENLTLTGTALNGTGNDLDNYITGNARNNTLNALGGNDHLVGGDGDDSLDGGAGNDVLSGELGNDT